MLEINYWPIFATASEIVRKLPEETAAAVLTPLRKGALRLVQRGVTKSHDLTGVIFQRLIADRKFLATFYTRPAAAALLAGLAIPADRAPGGAEWGDEETIASLQIGDFACGTGTLLSAAYQRISLLHELNGGNPRNAARANDEEWPGRSRCAQYRGASDGRRCSRGHILTCPSMVSVC